MTDADVVLGFIDPDYFLGGTMKLDKSAAERAIAEHLAAPLDLDVMASAAAIHRVVIENMAEAARVHSVEMNVDIRRHGVVAFGGAGPVHACYVAQRLHAPFVLCPANAGVLSALGLLIARLTYGAAHTSPEDLETISADHVNERLGALRARVERLLTAAGANAIEYEAWADIRYVGQGFEVATPVGNGDPFGAAKPGADVGRLLKKSFDEAYSEHYGRRLDDLPARVMTWHVSGTATIAPPEVADATPAAGQAKKRHRAVTFPEFALVEDCPIYERMALAPGDAIEGPAVIEEKYSAVVVPPGARASVNERLGILIDLGGEGSP